MTFYFYDLETSGINPRAQRIMQFAGQRTDMNLNPIGDPQNWLVKITEEILPDPEAVLITGITPQKSIDEGYTEAEFLKLFSDEVLQPDTIICGFNTIRFDDEFMRTTLWRNFYDPYEWQWQDGRSRWDLLDVVRIVRALRPEGIEWPFEDRIENTSDHGEQDVSGGKVVRVPSNRLELITKANGLDHDNAHDALSDVNATISVARLLKTKHPQMFEYLLKMRNKKQIKVLVNLDEKKPFVYTSGRYDSQYNKTTVAFPLTSGKNGNVVVYDLRYDPTPFLDLNEEELSSKIFANWDDRKKIDFVKLPIKELQYNKCPVVAPLGVLTQNNGWEHISLDEVTVARHINTLLSRPDFAERIRSIFEQQPEYKVETDPEFRLYDGFVVDKDKPKMRAARSSEEAQLVDLNLDFTDGRLNEMLPRYKARNFPKSLSKKELEEWNEYKNNRLKNGINGQLSLNEYITKLGKISVKNDDEKSQFLIQELKLYAESVLEYE
jgi:exodeoxyribonuclease-1